jgi:hypothetical protein
MEYRIASCSCGQLSARVGGEPVRNSICHCLACQRRTGSPFAHQAAFARADVAVSGVSTCYVRTGDEGTRASFHFCPRCGVTVYYEPEAFKELVMIPVGGFADPGFPAPTVSVYEARMHPWVIAPAGAAHYP